MKISLAIIGGVAILTGGIYAMGCWSTVDSGNRGVITRFGQVTGRILPEGLSGKGWFDKVIEMEVRTVKEQTKTEGASKDLQTVHCELAVNLHADPTRVSQIYQSIGLDYLDRVVAPAIQESAKATIAQFTAEELITKREIVREAIRGLLVGKMQPYGIIINEFNIINFDFSASFNAAIEAKVTAEQSAMAAKNKLAQIEFEAQQKVAEAKGKAESMRVESEAMKNSPQILELRALENGMVNFHKLRDKVDCRLYP